jgi:hypothetical protein
VCGIDLASATQGPAASLPSRIFYGEEEAVAMMTMGPIIGGFVGPYWIRWMREATGGYAVGVGGLFVPLLLTAFLYAGAGAAHGNRVSRGKGD